MGDRGNNTFQVTWKVKEKRRRRISFLIVLWGIGVENPGNGIVLKALSDDPKGIGDPVHL